jgi:hypothetical protein
LLETEHFFPFLPRIINGDSVEPSPKEGGKGTAQLLQFVAMRTVFAGKAGLPYT